VQNIANPPVYFPQTNTLSFPKREVIENKIHIVQLTRQLHENIAVLEMSP